MSRVRRLWDKLVNSRAAQGRRELVRRWWDALDEEPYVVEIEIPTAIDLSTLTIQKIRGLLAVYTVSTTHPGVLKLISHWRAADAYTGSKSSFFSKLGISVGSTPTAEGHQQQAAVRPPKPGWWRRHIEAVIGFVGVLAAIIGNVEKLRDPVLSLFLPPQVQITPARQSLDILSGEEFDAEFLVRNVSDWVSCDLAFGRVLAQPGDAVSIETVPGPFIGLAPGAAEPVKIHGVAKSAATDGLVDTVLSFAGDAVTWTRSRKQNLAAGNSMRQPFHLKVWPRRTVGVKQVGEVLQHGTRCRIDCQFMIGDEFARGFEVQAQLSDSDDVIFDRIQFLGSPKLDSLSDPNASKLTQVRWQAKDLKPGKRYQFSLFARSNQIRTEEKWRAVAQRATVIFGSLPPT
jgi:hypothetical protein